MTRTAQASKPAATSANGEHPSVREAEHAARRQRLDLAKLLQVNEAQATPEDLVLAQRVIAARADGAAYDKALADAAVAGLFRRGILFFGGTP